jgi:hypothetical protein
LAKTLGIMNIFGSSFGSISSPMQMLANKRKMLNKFFALKYREERRGRTIGESKVLIDFYSKHRFSVFSRLSSYTILRALN